MNELKQIMVRTVSLRRYALLLAVVWTLLVGGSLLWNINHERQEVLELTRAEARGTYNKDLVYRRWAAGHGGVYVPVSDKTPPNPYLSNVEERDIMTPSGRLLTLMNPAYMTRQVHELSREQYGLRGHITSLNPIRPENAPDPWEIEALRAFERGKLEVDSVERIDGQPYLRMMFPMVTEESCLKCHAEQGYEVGDIRGGMSVLVPMEPYRAVALGHILPLTLGHGIFWILGLSGLGLGTLHLNRRVRERERAEEALRERERFLGSVFQSIQDGLSILLPDLTIQRVNNVMNQWYASSLPLEGKKCYVAYHNRKQACDPCPTLRCMESGRTERDILPGPPGSHVKWVEVFSYPMMDPHSGDVLAVVEFLRDITDRKQAEEEMQESEEKYKLIYETSSDAIMTLKPPTWRFTSGNSAIVKMFGVKNEKEFISLRPWEVSPKYQPDGQLSAEKAKKMIETAMKKGKNFFEWTHQTVQGKDFFATVLLNRIEMKGKAFLQARVTDITERVKAEEQVRKQNEFLNNVLESLTHPFYVIDANDYTIKIANSALYPGKLSEKTTCYTLTHKRDKPCNGSDDPCPLEEIKKTKRPVVIEHVHYDKDGNPRNVEVHAYPILDDEGNVSEIIEYTLDITERKQ
ncbi:MAG: DUF3365 domain-containing protein, partial [Dehalococcoidia bacterium]|nr:DUF3365 domain-containing protein [Dehalococcoidia bacterium]